VKTKGQPRIAVDAWVRLKSTGQEGKVEAYQCGCYRVRLGAARYRIQHRDQLVRVRYTNIFRQYM
jgi:hypothetical protein